jgi:hypothetical protein
MSAHTTRMSLLPSAVVLHDVLANHAGDPPFEALERAGFRRDDVRTYLERRAVTARRACDASH